MQRLALLLLPPLLGGCHYPPDFGIRIDVTVPQDVQAALSSAHPGMVMEGSFPLAELCDPIGAPFTVLYSDSLSGHHCPDVFGPDATKISVVALSQSDIDWLNSNTPTFRCGQTRAISDQHTIDAIAERASVAGWKDNSQTIATGSGGSCDAAGNYTGTVLLHLVQ